VRLAAETAHRDVGRARHFGFTILDLRFAIGKEYGGLGAKEKYS
jgi:hypothetical protein